MRYEIMNFEKTIKVKKRPLRVKKFRSQEWKIERSKMRKLKHANIRRA
jgi:hypothetical protein